MSRSVPVARLQRQQQIQSGLSRILGAANGALAAVTAPAGDGETRTSAELWLYGVVGGYWFGFNDKTVADQLRGLNVDHITVRLNSPGGSVVQAIAIGNLLRNHKASVTVVVDGLAASAAPLIAIAGDEIIMSPGSQMMLHDPWMLTVGNAKELRWDADFLDKQGANMAATFALRSETTEAWRAAMTAEPDGTWYTAEEAVAANLADRVGTVVAVGAAPEPPAVDLDNEDDDDIAARAAWDLEVLISPAARAAWNHGAPATPKPPTASAGGSTHPEGGSAVAFSDEQLTTMRAKLELPADADEAAILAAIDAVVEDSLEEKPSGPADPAAIQIPKGTVLVDQAVWEKTQQDAAAGAGAAQAIAKQEREQEFKAAMEAGKITADTAKTLREKVEAEPESWAGTKALLDALTPGLVPTAAVGHESEPSALGDGIEMSDAEMDAFATSLGLSKEALRG